MEKEWIRWTTTINPEGKIYFPQGALDYLSEVNGYCKIFEKFAREEIDQKLSYEVDPKGDNEIYVKTWNARRGPGFDIHVPRRLVSRGRNLFILAAVNQREAALLFKKGRYLLICPYHAHYILAEEMRGSIAFGANKFFKGIITSFDRWKRIYVPAEFQKIIGIEKYKDSIETGNIVIRAVIPKGKFMFFSKEDFDFHKKHFPKFGYWLEIWDRKDLEK